MARIQSIAANAALLAVLMTGCSTPLFDRADSNESRSVQLAQPIDETPSTSPEVTAPLPRNRPNASQTTESQTIGTQIAASQIVAAREEAMANMLDQLDLVRQIDPDAQQRLLTELRQKKTDEWPLLVSQFHASLKYRQQLDGQPDRQFDGNIPKLATNKEDVDAAKYKSQPPTVPNELVSTEALPMRKGEGEVEPAKELSPTQERDQQGELAENAAAEMAPVIQLVSSEISRPLPPIAESEEDLLDWHQHVELAIDLLESRAGESEATESPVLQQVQQKLLQLVAGHSDDAMLPIFGATPHVQRYWSEQFFALSTLTNHDSKLGEDRRAAQAAQHLNEALTHLRDLSTLTVHHLAFCERVFDFGAYEPHEDNRFTKNQEVTLYAEVENYSSELTNKGYHTWFASRYEVLDDQGRRIDGGNFPDVEDTCQNRRRDFHIQYALPLPERAKPGKYKLQLTVEDRLNGREGTNVIEFDLVGP